MKLDRVIVRDMMSVFNKLDLVDCYIYWHELLNFSYRVNKNEKINTLRALPPSEATDSRY